MRKKKIVIQTNNPLIKTGLGENGRFLLKYLLEKCSHKYDIVYYCTQTSVADPVINTFPCKAYGSLPNDPHIINQLNSDPGRARDVSYGSFYIDEIIKKEQPDCILFSDDIWGFSLDNYARKPWHKKLSPIYHITVDSRPVLDQAFEQAKSTSYFTTWANFAAKEMKKFGPNFSHIKSVYGMFDTEIFRPISKEDKLKLRERFGIDPNAIIFTYLSRNQLRKSFPAILEAFAQFKREFPSANVKLHFHTSFSEKGNGWDIPKLIAYYGINPQDVLATYVCKNCGQWEIKPYTGEDLDCKFCGAQKSQVSANIVNGVPDDEMKFLYGISDASINAFTSGGLERSIPSSLLCGLPTACTNYSSGEDFCEQSFVYALDWKPYYEPHTNFIKAATTINSIKNFIAKIYKMPLHQRYNIGQKSREWALKTFAIDVIGKQWEEIFDSCPYADWSNFKWEPEQKNPDFILPQNYKELPECDFLKIIYKEILKMDVSDNDSGLLHWINQLKNGISRDQIVDFFRKTAFDDNQKNKKQDFWDLIDRDRPKKRALYLIKESLGDCLISSQLFESFHEEYPNTDLYVACDLKFAEIFEGNSHIYKILPYQNFMEQEMIMISAAQDKNNQYFHYFFHPAIMSQRQLQYLSSK